MPPFTNHDLASDRRNRGPASAVSAVTVDRRFGCATASGIASLSSASHRNHILTNRPKGACNASSYLTLKGALVRRRSRSTSRRISPRVATPRCSSIATRKARPRAGCASARRRSRSSTASPRSSTTRAPRAPGRCACPRARRRSWWTARPRSRRAPCPSSRATRNKVIVPVLPSDIDIHAASRCIADLLLVAKIKRAENRIGVIANRVRKNTLMFQSLMRFLEKLEIPIDRDDPRFAELRARRRTGRRHPRDEAVPGQGRPGASGNRCWPGSSPSACWPSSPPPCRSSRRLAAVAGRPGSGHRRHRRHGRPRRRVHHPELVTQTRTRERRSTPASSARTSTSHSI